MTMEVQVLQYFELDLVNTVIRNLKKRPIIWQDPFDSGVNLPNTVVLDVWKDWIMGDSVKRTTAAGYDIIFSACWYLDHLDEDWWKFHQCNPRGFGNINAEQQAHILGGHGSIWAEHVDSTNFFARVWPRMSAAAEVLWSGSPNVASQYLVQARLVRFRCWMVQQYDIPASPIAPDYCSEHGMGEAPFALHPSDKGNDIYSTGW